MFVVSDNRPLQTHLEFPSTNATFTQSYLQNSTSQVVDQVPVRITGRLLFKGVHDFGLGKILSVSVASWKAGHLDVVPLESSVVIGRTAKVQIQRFAVV